MLQKNYFSTLFINTPFNKPHILDMQGKVNKYMYTLTT